MNVIIIPVGILAANCYLLYGESKNCIVIDPGAQPEKLISTIEKAGLTPKMILLTHGHPDHIGAVKGLMARYPETAAELYIGEQDMELLTDADNNRSLYPQSDPDDFHIRNTQPLVEAQELTLDDLTVRVVHTPGHTRGGVVYLCENLMFTGDTMFRRECGRCDLYGGDFEAMKVTLNRLAALPGDYVVYPGHGESSTLEYERKHNPYIGL